MIIAVDFDGTIVDHDFPKIGKPVPNAIKWLRRLNNCGAKIILYTMRSDSSLFPTALTDAKKYLHENGIPLYSVNENPSQAEWTTSPKVHADVYVDDLAIGCPLVHPRGFKRACVDWDEIGPELERMCLSKSG